MAMESVFTACVISAGVRDTPAGAAVGVGTARTALASNPMTSALAIRTNTTADYRLDRATPEGNRRWANFAKAAFSAPPEHYLVSTEVRTGFYGRSMKNRRRRSASLPISNSRWLAYAAAGLATSVVGRSAEAEIHYSGPVNISFDSTFGQPDRKAFELAPDHGAQMIFGHYGGSYGTAGFIVNGAVSAGFVGYPFQGANYVSKLQSGATLSGKHFRRNDRNRNGNRFAFLAVYSGGQFEREGTGFVGFKFNSGSGVQYGWARVHSDGFYENSFTVIDYAYADPGEAIKTGQTTSDTMALGSIGLLAAGAAGLVAWRRQRAAVAE
jgi:LPXTG-motif cell wall-anchored protein